MYTEAGHIVEDLPELHTINKERTTVSLHLNRVHHIYNKWAEFFSDILFIEIVSKIVLDYTFPGTTIHDSVIGSLRIFFSSCPTMKLLKCLHWYCTNKVKGSFLKDL